MVEVKNVEKKVAFVKILSGMKENKMASQQKAISIMNDDVEKLIRSKFGNKKRNSAIGDKMKKVGNMAIIESMEGYDPKSGTPEEYFEPIVIKKITEFAERPVTTNTYVARG